MKKDLIKSIIKEELKSVQEISDAENHINNLIGMVSKHDFAYEYSDNHGTWQAGRASEDRIQKAVDDLISKGVPADELLHKLKSGVKERFDDGLVHRTIGYWFTKHLN